MANSYTRAELISRQEFNATMTAQAYTFTLVNDLPGTVYFNIEGSEIGGEGGIFKDTFNSASIGSLTNCSVVSGSKNAAFIIDPLATATFTLTPVVSLKPFEFNFFAANQTITRIGGSEATRAFGVDLAITP